MQLSEHRVESNAVDDDDLMTLCQIRHEQIWQRICEGSGDRIAGVGRERRDADRSGGERVDINGPLVGDGSTSSAIGSGARRRHTSCWVAGGGTDQQPCAHNLVLQTLPPDARASANVRTPKPKSTNVVRTGVKGPFRGPDR